MAVLVLGGALLVGAIIVVVLATSSGKKDDPSGGGVGAGGTPDKPPAKTKGSPEEERYKTIEAKARKDRTKEALAEFGALAWKNADDAEKKGDEPALKRFRSDARWAYKAVLDKDPDDAIARERLGDLLFDLPTVRAYLEAPYVPIHLRTDLEMLIENIETDVLKGKATKVWLGPKEKYTKEWAAIHEQINRLKKVEESKKTDPFYSSAEEMGQKLLRELSSKSLRVDFRIRDVTGDPFKPIIKKPYVLLVQREPSGGEDRVGADWGVWLEDLQKTFYSKFGDKTKLPPMNVPTPIIILKDSSEYAKYIRKDDAPGSAATPVTSGGHYEPWSNRLVVYRTNPEADREVLFHEGTHQIVEFATRTTGTKRGMAQSLWFSEGIADYFGGHGQEWDAERRTHRYIPGMINKERVEQIVKAKAAGALFPLPELLQYSRADYQVEKNDPTKANRTLNGYIQGWALVFFLNNWKDGKYHEEFVEYLKEEFDGRSGKAAFEKIFGKYGIDSIESDVLEMIDELQVAFREGRIVNGRLIPPK